MIALAASPAAAVVDRPLLRYYGGKWRLAPWILKHLPPHVCYVEPFAGAASVLLRKKPAAFEYLNDADEEIVNLFAMLRDCEEELLRAVALTPYARAEFDLAWEVSDNRLERARRLVVRGWMSRGGARCQWRTGWRTQRLAARGRRVGADWARIGERLEPIIHRLRGVSLECDDALKILDRYEAPSTLYYCDPPYLGSTRSERWRNKAYLHELSSEEDHGRLLAALLDLNAMVVLSGYPSDLYRRELEEGAGWRRFEKRARTDAGYAIEALWLNPRALAALAGQQGEIFAADPREVDA